MQDEELQTDVCHTLSNIMDTGGEEHVQLVLEQGLLTRLAELLSPISTAIQRCAAAKAICHIGKSTNVLHRMLLLRGKLNIITNLMIELLNSEDDTVKYSL